jgi:tetratricopeptide (TPR) repeat protein
LIQNEELDSAIQYAQKALELDEMTPEAYQVLGQAHILRQEWDKAIEQYQKILKFEPENLEIIEDLAIIYTRVQRYDDAIDLYRRLARLDSSQPVLYHFRVATLLYQLNRLEEALQEYQALAKLVPQYYEVFFKIGNIQEALEKPQDAIEAYITALDLVRNPQEELMIRQRLGALYRAQNQDDNALEQYEKLKELNPSDLDIRRLLILLYIAREDYQSSLKEIEYLLNNLPGDFRLALLHREVLENLNRSEEGYKAYLDQFAKSIAEQKDQDVYAFLWDLSRDDTLEDLHKYHLLQVYQESLQKYHPDEESRGLFAQAKLNLYLHQPLKLKNHLQAILKNFNRAAKQKNKEWFDELSFEIRLWYPVRRQFKEQGLLTDLLDCLHEGQEAFDSDQEARQTLAILYIDQQDWMKAEDHLLAVKNELNSKSLAYKDILFQLGSVYEKQKRISAVEEIMKEAMELYPDDAQVYNFLGYTYADHNVRLEEALKLIEKAHQMAPEDGNIVDSLGWVYYRLGKYELAIQHLKKAVDMETNHPVILEHLGDACQKAGDLDSAILYWKQSLEFGPDHPYEFTDEFRERLKSKLEKAESSDLP